MNAPFPVNPSIGEWFGNWVWNGNRWVCGPTQGVRVIIRRFTASGPWQPSPGLISVEVECIGGGGGGGGALGSVPTTTGAASGPGWCVGGGGGSGGTYAKSALAETLVRGGVNMTVGIGGAGGQATQATAGEKGGNTAFGAFVVAQGGWGGGSNVVTGGTLDPNFGQGADPGAEPGESLPGAINDVGDMTGFGDAGQSGTTTWYDPGGAGLIAQTIAWGGTGGGTFYSGTWAAVPQTEGGENGRNGYLSGVGGGGGASAYAANPALGGNGADGVIVTTEYCFAQTDDSCGPSFDVNARVAWDGQSCPPKGGAWRGGPPAGFSDDPSAYDNGE